MNNSSLQQQASDWLAAMNSDQVTDAERERFMAWLDTSPQHAEAYHQADAVWAEVAELSELKALEPIQLAEEQQASAVKEHRSGIGAFLQQGLQQLFARPALSLSAAAVVVLATLALFNPGMFSPAPASVLYNTQTAEIRTIDLPDGSTLTLGAQSRAEVSLGETDRRVRLTGGQAFFDIVKDPNRPFVVEAGNAQVLVLGTRFDVRHAANNVHVAVAEGMVDVAVADKSQHQKLQAGQTTVALASGELQPVREIAVDKLGAWRDGRLIYNDSPLSEVVADANRYYSRPIRLASGGGLEGLTITASFRTDQIEQMLNNLAVTYPVDIVSIPGGDLVIKPRR